MASCCNNHLTSERPHFFKIILEDSEAMREKKLLVPRRFVREYGHEISAQVQVKDPSGRKWKLEWLNCDGENWLKNGWKEFADFHSLNHGHLLVFEYEGKSQFSVLIFDKSATDIKSPMKRIELGNEQYGKAREVKEETTDDEELGAQFFDDPTPSLPKKRKKSPLKFSSRPPKMRTSFEGESAKKKCQRMKLDLKEKKVTGDEVKARKKAVAFKSKYPNFSCVMQPSYVSSGRDKLHLPFRFCEEYVNCIAEDETQVFLHSNERCWEMTYHFEEKCSRAEIGNGWKIFSRDHDLKVGDVCVFELISETEIKFNVRIFRTDEQTSHCPSAGKQKQVAENKDIIRKKQVAEKKDIRRKKQVAVRKDIRRKVNKKHPRSRVYGNDESADTKYPFFLVNMKRAYLHNGYLHIPTDFVKDHIKKGLKSFTLVAQNWSWDVIYDDPGRFYGGWSAFVDDNGLQVGDTCIFRLVRENVLKVDIFGSIQM